MKLQIVAIKDRATDAFGRPIFVNSLGQAVRSFIDEVNNKQSELNKHPEDYDLYHLGNFDDTTGQTENLVPAPHQIAIGKHVINNGE